MAVTLTPEEQAIYNKNVTDEPGNTYIPSPEAIANGTETGDDIVVTPPSGIAQDVINAQAAIDRSDQTIIDLQNEQNMQIKLLNNFHYFLRNYEDEIRLTNGEYEASPWQPAEATSEANNIFNNVNTRYFPNGMQTNPLEINSFPEETYSATKLIDPSNLIALFPVLELAVDAFTTTYTNTERTNDIPLGAIPGSPTPQEILDFNNAKDLIHTEINNVLPVLNAATALLIPPYLDDSNATAPSAAATRKLQLEATALVLSTLDALTILNDAALSDFQTNRLIVVNDANARLAEITTFATPAFYNLRSIYGVELADFGEGIIYKKLSEQLSNATLISRKAKLQRKLDAYNAVSGII